MNIVYVSTWGGRCGIATYSEQLVGAVRNEGARVHVLAPLEPGSGMDAPEEISVEHVWSRSAETLPAALLPRLDGFDVVHFQHEHGLFLQPDVFLLTLREAARKAVVVVTLHTITPFGSDESGFFEKVCRFADVVIAHTVQGVAALTLAARGKENVVHIPHGTYVEYPGDRNTGLRRLQMPKALARASWGGSFGFVSEGKNVVNTVRAFAAALTHRLLDPDRHGFIVCGHPWNRIDNELRRIAISTGWRTNFYFHFDFVARSDVRHILSVLDYGVLNSKSEVLSASGQAHTQIGFGLPLAVCAEPIYQDAINAGALPFEGDLVSTTQAIAALASSARLRASIQAGYADFVAATRWGVIAQRHLAVYAAALALKSMRSDS